MSITKMTMYLYIAVSFFVSIKAMAQEEQTTKLQSFTSQTNYMSIEGFERYQNYLRTGEWKRIKRFHLWNDVYLEDCIKFEKNAMHVSIGGPNWMFESTNNQDGARRAAHVAFAVFPEYNTCVVDVVGSSTFGYEPSFQMVLHRPHQTLK